MRHPFRRAILVLILLLLWVPAWPRFLGYSLYRVVLWGRPGEEPPRFDQDPNTRSFRLLFPPAAPETGWDPVSARCFELHGGAFVPGDPVKILRARDPSPDWSSRASEGSLDINLDGQAEVVRAKNVLIPDSRDPSAARQRVLVTLWEGDRILFADLIAGPSSGSARLHSIFSTDFTGEGYPDIVVYLEAEDRTGAAFYSQTRLQYAGEGTREIDGVSADFRSDAYGIFDLTRTPKDFFSRLPSAARANRQGCPETKGTEGDGLVHCWYQFSAPYLGWIQAFEVGFAPNRGLRSFNLFFPTGTRLSPEQALEFLTPVLGIDYRADTRPRRDGSTDLTWQWRDKGSVATLRGVESAGARRSTVLTLERP